MISDFSLIRIKRNLESELVHHILELPESDRYLRFGYSAQEYNIRQYVEKSLSNDAHSNTDNYWWGVKDDSTDKLVATIHVAVTGDTAEFAFTTDVNYRGRKIGQLLFARGYQLVTELLITKIFMVCLSQNAPMRHIASKFGLSVTTIGSDSEAEIRIKHPVSLSKMELVKMN